MWSAWDHGSGRTSRQRWYRRRRICAGMLLFVAAGWRCEALGQRPTAPWSSGDAAIEDVISDELFHLPVDDELADRIDATIVRLDNPIYKEREKATEGLIEIGASAFSKLRGVYRDTDTFELRLRIERIVHAGYFNYHVYDGNGFLGVSMRAYPAARQPIKGIPKDTVGVVVAAVIKETGAERAGVKKNDVIVAVDGRSLSGVGNKLLDNLSERIRSTRPGHGLKLEVLRGRRRLTFDVTLGRCPPKQAKRNVRGTTDLYRKAARRFPVWWTTYFENDLTAGVAGS